MRLTEMIMTYGNSVACAVGDGGFSIETDGYYKGSTPRMDLEGKSQPCSNLWEWYQALGRGMVNGCGFAMFT